MSELESAKKHLHAAINTLTMPDHLADILSNPKHVLQDTIEIQMDSGETKSFDAYRVQHSNALGPYKGGIRFHPTVHLDEVKALAMWMSWKSALLNLPLGGGKGGIIVNPKELSKSELQRLSRGFVRAFHEHLGPMKDVPAPDVYTNAQIMSWMLDEFETIKEEHAPGTFTGKPLELGGIAIREQATGLGGFFITDAAATFKKMRPADTTVAIQGFGNVGYNIAQFLHSEGYKIVALSDSKGAIYNPDGLDPRATFTCKIEKGKIADCYALGSVEDDSAAKSITNEELLELDVDILVPSALGNVITKENAANIKASLIVEMANGPISHDADELLTKKGTIIVPDILANAGGVTGSYFEWVQNNSGDQWSYDDSRAKLKAIMNSAFERVAKTAQADDISFREAAYLIAVEKVARAVSLRGSSE